MEAAGITPVQNDLDEIREAAKDPRNVTTVFPVPGVRDLDPWQGGTFDASAEGLNTRAMAAVEKWTVTDDEKEAALSAIVNAHPRMKQSGECRATPKVVVEAQKKFHDAMETLT